MDFRTAVTKGEGSVFNNSGQSCNAPTRMFVPADRIDEVEGIAEEAASKFTVGDPQDGANKLGPVLSILTCRDEEEVIAMANDTVYALAAYVQSDDLGHARRVAARMRAGSVHVNYQAWGSAAPFGATSNPATAANTLMSDWRSSSKPRQ